MKLRNKQTGEIIEKYPKDMTINTGSRIYNYHSLAELNEEWEDYEGPKEYWYIDYDGGILCGEYDNSSAEKMMISLGNHFETLEEAEKAVEKLKAWKRLKDKGFRFNGWKCTGGIEFTFDNYVDKGERTESAVDDLDLLFGGEE